MTPRLLLRIPWRRLPKVCDVTCCSTKVILLSFGSAINLPPSELKNELDMTPVEGIAATVQDIIRLEGELNRAQARLAV